MVRKSLQSILLGAALASGAASPAFAQEEPEQEVLTGSQTNLQRALGMLSEEERRAICQPEFEERQAYVPQPDTCEETYGALSSTVPGLDVGCVEIQDSPTGNGFVTSDGTPVLATMANECLSREDVNYTCALTFDPSVMRQRVLLDLSGTGVTDLNDPSSPETPDYSGQLAGIARSIETMVRMLTLSNRDPQYITVPQERLLPSRVYGSIGGRIAGFNNPGNPDSLSGEIVGRVGFRAAGRGTGYLEGSLGVNHDFSRAPETVSSYTEEPVQDTSVQEQGRYELHSVQTTTTQVDTTQRQSENGVTASFGVGYQTPIAGIRGPDGNLELGVSLDLAALLQVSDFGRARVSETRTDHYTTDSWLTQDGRFVRDLAPTEYTADPEITSFESERLLTARAGARVGATLSVLGKDDNNLPTFYLRPGMFVLTPPVFGTGYSGITNQTDRTDIPQVGGYFEIGADF